MTEENWIDWPNGAQLKDLPVGSRVRYREAHYVRTENGLRVYWAGRAKKIVGTEYLLSKQAFIEPIKVSLPPGYRFEGSEVVKIECGITCGCSTECADDNLGDTPEHLKPTCKCGATENVRPIAVEYVTSWGKKQYGGEDICAPCYVARRRAELRAQKLEQTKRDMNRPVKRDPYEWLGFSSADWEE